MTRSMAAASSVKAGGFTVVVIDAILPFVLRRSSFSERKRMISRKSSASPIEGTAGTAVKAEVDGSCCPNPGA